MTKTSGVNFRGKNFWVYDVVGGVFLRHLILAAEKHLSDQSSPWLKSVIEKWKLAAVITEMAYFADDDWSDEQINLVLDFCKNAVNSIRAHGDFTKAEVSSWTPIENLKFTTRGLEIVPSEPIARFGEAFISLLLDELPIPPAMTWWFYSLENSPETLNMACN